MKELDDQTKSLFRLIPLDRWTGQVMSTVDPVTSVGQTVSLVCLVMDSGWNYCRARYEADRGKAFKNIPGKIDPAT